MSGWPVAVSRALAAEGWDDDRVLVHFCPDPKAARDFLFQAGVVEDLDDLSARLWARRQWAALMCKSAARRIATTPVVEAQAHGSALQVRQLASRLEGAVSDALRGRSLQLRSQRPPEGKRPAPRRKRPVVKNTWASWLILFWKPA